MVFDVEFVEGGVELGEAREGAEVVRTEIEFLEVGKAGEGRERCEVGVGEVKGVEFGREGEVRGG